MKALLLAAGFGVRMREVLHGRPKHLFPIHGKPFLRYVIDLLKNKGITEVVLAVGYLSQYIRDEFRDYNGKITIHFSEDSRPMGTAGSLKHAQRYFKEDFLVVNADTYLDIDYQKVLTFHKTKKALITLVGTTQVANKIGGVIQSRDGQVKELIPNSQVKDPNQQLLHTGIYAVSPQIFHYLKTGLKTSLEKEIIPYLLKSKKQIYVYKTQQPFIDIDSPRELDKATAYLKMKE